MTTSWPFRLLSLVAALAWCLVAAGYAQDAGTACGAPTIDGNCQTARRSSPDGTQTPIPLTASRPIVTYVNGKLTVTAWNASLAEVLRAISAQTGTVIDFPAGSAADRIVVREGPGTIRQVLTNLLNGSGFNYVIMGSLDTPDKLTRVVLAKPGPFSPQPAIEQDSRTPDQAKTVPDPLLWTPPSSSPLWTAPKEDPLATVSPAAGDDESLQPPKEPLPPDVLEQMMRDRTRQLHEQAQQPQ